MAFNTGSCGPVPPGSPYPAYLGIWKPESVLRQDSEVGEGSIENWRNIDCSPLPEETFLWRNHLNGNNAEPMNLAGGETTVSMTGTGFLFDHTPRSSQSCFAVYKCCSTRAEEDIGDCLDVTELGDVSSCDGGGYGRRTLFD